MRRASIRVPAGSLEELRWGLGEVGRGVLEAQPAMAPLVSLVRNVLAAVASATSVEEGRHAGASAADDFRAGVESRAREVAEWAAAVLAGVRTVATISSSSTVRAALLTGEEARRRSVICFESRPMQEGRELAGSLAAAGVEVTLAVDAAAHSLVPQCDAVVLGCDSIGDRGVVNKIGSAGLAQAGVRAGVPVCVLADETKILPRGFPQTVDDDRPAAEVWTARPGVRVWNRYFEVVPLLDVTAVITESGPLDPEALERARTRLEFPEALRRWAERR